MRYLKVIDGYLFCLLKEIECVQNEDGSFGTYFNQPYYHPDLDWMKWPGNSAFDTASVLIPLLFLENKPYTVLEKGVKYLLKDSLHNRFWRFSPGNGYIIPFDTESTSLSSFVITSFSKKNIRNKKYINRFKNKEGNYKLFFFPPKLDFSIPIHTSISLIYKNITSSSESKLTIRKDDWEFATNCNNLLYIGWTKKNEKTWVNIKNDFQKLNIKHTYYNLFYNVYTYARLSFYGGHTSLILDVKSIKDTVIFLYSLLDKEYSLNHVFLTNTILMFRLSIVDYKDLISTCFNDIKEKKYLEFAPYYTNNSVLGANEQTKKPNTLFTAKGFSHSLYIEFLNLYKKSLK